jgi:hypothetical protein
MSSHTAFICYVHADDDGDGGRILHLAHDLGAEFAAISGDNLNVITDRAHLMWGDDWRSTLTEAVGNATFLIPFITPRFFGSDECRRELELYQRTAADFNRPELVLPILYIEVPDLHADESDPARALVARIQYEIWTDLRFEDRISSVYRRGVNRLAKSIQNRIVTLGDPAPTRALATSIPKSGDETRDAGSDNPGVFDVLAEDNESVEKMTQAIVQIGELMAELGEVTSHHAARFTKTADAKALIANRVLVSGSLATALEPIADGFESQVATYRANMERASLLYDALFSIGTFADNRETSRALANAIIETGSSAFGAFTSVDGLIENIRQVEGFSRALRRPLQRIRRSIQSFRDTEPTLSAWAQDAATLIYELDSQVTG